MQNTKENPEWEAERIKVLKKYEILDTPPDGSFDHLTQMAAELLDMPISIITLVDTDRIWFKSKVGIDIQEIERKPGLCSSAILANDLYLVEDAKKDVRTLANPLVAGEFGLRFYSSVPLLTSEGFNLGTFCVIDKKPREFSESHQKILRNLAQLVVQQMELRLEARLAVKNQYEILNTTAHHLKNPLSLMPLLADMLLENKENPKAIDDIARQIKSAGRKINKTINELLETAKEDTGKIKLTIKAINLNLLVKGVVAANQNLAGKKEQDIKVIVPNKCLIYGDHRRLTQVVDNLIKNAIKYSPLRKEIHVSLKSTPKKIILKVRDQGPELTREDFKNLFKKFTILSVQPTGGEKSTGMELFNVKQFVEAHKGEITAENNPGATGTTFTVEFPVPE